ncbi:prepilin-type N-terminal cleavage/methylation domain-containing protein, partial [Candidatus Saccharibacteria bacterium]|nr:prepilin-type N-terminal cleavage/methylation domain-containing protein [Candidatus Saccharibacteria bacterium]
MKKNQRGDTLVEVLIALTVLGVIIVGVMATMTRSMVSVLNSAERTASRADINTQTDLLNYVYRNDKTTWYQIMSLAYTGNPDGSAPTNVTDTCTLNPGGDSNIGTPGSFYIEPEFDGDSVSGVTLIDNLTEIDNGINEVQRAIPGQGMWIDAVYYEQNHSTNERSYVDFYIKACWVRLGQTSPEANSRSVTVTRIYDYSLDNAGLYLTIGSPINYTQCGVVQRVTVAEAGWYQLQVWGAQGAYGSKVAGGGGGYSAGNVQLQAGDRLYIHVGCHPASNTYAGGWNGGGDGAIAGDGKGGGGATDIRIGIDSLYARVIVAGGGAGGTGGSGGGQTNSGDTPGGCGGGTNGCDGQRNGSNPVGYIGGGGKQTTAGQAATVSNPTNPTSGKFGKGGFGGYGLSSTCSQGGAGGGGGWYGGGGGACDNGQAGSGGGGSGWIWTAAT